MGWSALHSALEKLKMFTCSTWSWYLKSTCDLTTGQHRSNTIIFRSAFMNICTIKLFRCTVLPNSLHIRYIYRMCTRSAFPKSRIGFILGNVLTLLAVSNFWSLRVNPPQCAVKPFIPRSKHLLLWMEWVLTPDSLGSRSTGSRVPLRSPEEQGGTCTVS